MIVHVYRGNFIQNPFSKYLVRDSHKATHVAHKSKVTQVA